MDWAVIKQLAYGPLNLKPDELGRMVYCEFLELLEGYQWREKRELEKLAQLASWVTAPHLKTPVNPQDLISDPKERKKTTTEETNEVISSLAEKMGVNL